ncbi:UNVERIFIED_ORG: RNA-directed DNA polymerase [Stenotrophomonas geniculata]
MPVTAPSSPIKKALSERAVAFHKIQSRSELSEWLGIDEKKILFILYKLSDSEKYKEFAIPKRNGGTRTISAPLKSLKFIQKQISSVLYEICPPRLMAKGYVPGRGIYDHAAQHRRKSIVVATDIKNFFPSIHFGRVRGLFLAPPFLFTTEIATILAQLCCKNGQLPQGSPSSPAISNIICRSLDLQLLSFAKKHRLSVSRYADDICFSTNQKRHSSDLLGLIPTHGYVAGAKLCKIFERSGFSLNPKKFKISKDNSQQMVTGLVVNNGVATPRRWRRQLRTLLHLRRKFDEKTATAVVNNWTSPPPSRKGSANSIDRLIQGKSSFARYLDSRTGTNYVASLHRAFPALRELLPRVTPTFPVRVMTEGPTDLVHLESALAYYQDQLDLNDVSIKFHNYQGDQGDAETLQTLYRIAKVDVDELTIGFFDYDNLKLLKEISLGAGEHVRLGRMVFAACLARPHHAQENSLYCIESLYRKSQASAVTSEGRRLFFGEEFDPTGHSLDGRYRREFPRKTALILSERVVEVSNPTKSLTLSKVDFADLVKAKSPPFSSMDFSGFLPTLINLRKMIDEAIRHHKYRK